METARRARYRIVYSPTAERYVITDDHLAGAVCSLPDATGHLKPLTFRNAKGARLWLTAMK